MDSLDSLDSYLIQPSRLREQLSTEQETDPKSEAFALSLADIVGLISAE